MTIARPTPSAGWVDRTVDVAGALAVTAIMLSGFDTTFVDRYYFVVGMVGAAICVLFALLAAQGGIGWFLLGGLGGYILVGTMLVEGDNGALAAPTSSAVLEFLRQTVTGPIDLLTTIPPLDSGGGALAVPFELGFFVAGLSALIALRTSRPLLPVLPAVAGIAAVSVLASLEISGTAVRGALFAVVTLLWGVARAGRVGHAGDTAAMQWARPLLAAVVVVPAVLAGAAVERGHEPDERATLRGVVGNGAEIDERDNPLVLFRQYTRQQSGYPTVYDERLMRVTGVPQETPIRFVALDVYDGTAWRAGNRTVGPGEDDLYQRIGSQIYTRRPGRAAEVSVDLSRYYVRGWLPQSDQLTSVTFDKLDGRAQREDVRYNPATSSALVVGGLVAGDDYHYTSVVPRDTLSPRSHPYPVDKPLQPAGARLDRLLRPWVRSGLGPMHQVFDLADFLRKNGWYSDGAGDPSVPAGHDIKRLTRGFFGAEHIIGDDEQYAAFMALAANRLGVPARVVVGAVTQGPVVRGKNVAAWVEIRVADGSWRRMPTATFMSHRWWTPPEAEQELDQPVRPRPEQPDTQRPEPPQADQSEDRVGQLAADRSWWVAVLAVAVLLVPGLKLGRRWWRRGHGDPAARVAAGWVDLMDTAADVGRPPAVGLTRVGQASALGVDPEVAALADGLVFARRPAHAADAAEFWRRLPRERRAVANGVHPVRRNLAWWNARSLLRRRVAAPGRSRRSRSRV